MTNHAKGVEGATASVRLRAVDRQVTSACWVKPLERTER